MFFLFSLTELPKESDSVKGGSPAIEVLTSRSHSTTPVPSYSHPASPLGSNSPKSPISAKSNSPKRTEKSPRISPTILDDLRELEEEEKKREQRAEEVVEVKLDEDGIETLGR